MKKRVSWMTALGILCAAATPALGAAKAQGDVAQTGTAAAMSRAQGRKLQQSVQAGDRHALARLRQAARTGDVVAQNVLGTLYDHGHGVRQDYVEAARWYRKAAEQGCAPAQVNLGMLYSDGRGVGRDYHQAEQWLLKAADQGNANGMTSLGILYELGLGVQRNRIVAYALYSLAIAHGGHKDAVFYHHRLHAYIDRAARAKARVLMQRMQKAKSVSSVLEVKAP